MEHGMLHINITSCVLELKAYQKSKVGHYLHPSPIKIILLQSFFYFNGSNTNKDRSQTGLLN